MLGLRRCGRERTSVFDVGFEIDSLPSSTVVVETGYDVLCVAYTAVVAPIYEDGVTNDPDPLIPELERTQV